MEFPEKLWLLLEMPKTRLEHLGIMEGVPAHGLILKVPSNPGHSMIP